MTIDFRCPQCAKWYKVSDNLAGRKAKCKACGAEMVVPAPTPAPASEPSEELRPLAGTSLIDEWADNAETSGKTLPPVSYAGRADAPPEAAPAAKPRRSSGRAAMSNKVARLSIPFLIFGGMLLFIAHREGRLAALSDATPQKMTLSNLVANGPGNNIHMELSDFCLLPDLSVIESDGKDLNTSTWKYVWIPAVPRGWLGLPRMNQIKVVVGAGGIGNAAKLEEFCRQTTLQGMVVNETDKIDAEARKLLNEGLPGMDVASCYFFRVGRKPMTSGLRTLMLLGGCVLLVAGLGIGGLYLRGRFA